MVGASEQTHSNPSILSRLPIYSRQLALIGLISLMTLVAGWFGAITLKHKLIATSGEMMALMAADIATQLDLILVEHYRDIQFLANIDPLTRQRDSRAALLRTFKRTHSSYAWIGVTDATGRVVEATNPATIGHDGHAEPWYLATKERGMIYIGDVETDALAEGREVVSFTTSIERVMKGFSRPSFAGVVSTRVETQTIERMVTDTLKSFQHRGMFYGTVEYQILREDGRVFIDSDLRHKGNVNLKEIGLASVLLSQNSAPSYIEEEHLRRQTTVMTGYAKTHGHGQFPNPGWTVLLRVDRADVLAPLYRFLWIVSGAGLLFVVPMIVWLVKATGQAQVRCVEAEEERARSRNNERRLRSILESVPEGVLVIGHDRRVLEINPAGCALFDAGFSEEILGRRLTDFVHDADRRLLEDVYETARKGQESCGRGRLIGLSGQIRWIEMTSVPFIADDGIVQSVLSMVRDVTEQKRADRRQALQHAVAKVLAEASTVDQAIPELLRAITVSLDWRVGLFWLVQNDRRTMICKWDWSVDVTAVQNLVSVSRQHVYVSGCGLPGRCWASGEPLWVEDVTKDPESSGAPRDTGNILHAACAFPVWLRANVFGVMEFFSRDVHQPDWDLLKALSTIGSQIGLFIERTEVEAALHESEARTRLIIDTALEAVITADRDGRIIEWNAQAERIFGWSALEVIGRELADTIIPPDHRPSYGEYVRSLLEPRDLSASNMLVEMNGLRRDGRQFPVEIAMTPLPVEGSVIFSAFIRDITSRKEAEQALKDYAQQLERINQQLDVAWREAKAATEAKSSFLATMSHEIRTPMNGVIGMTGLLLDTKLTDEQKEYAETVRTCGDHLLMIINDILDFSKIEAGKLDLEVIEFDLRLAIEESLDLMAERASSKGLNLACLFHADVPRNLVGDPGRLRQVVMNLTANAIKFTESGDIVLEVTAEAPSKDEATIRVAVTDTGIGISEEGRERLFQPFSQADGSTTRKYGGTGLGLAICKRLVEMMGGTIGVTSRAGEGSCFWFRVNLRKQAETSRGDESSAVALAGLRVLIVDDKAINRRILELMTRKWGMQPTLVDSGSAALQILSPQHGRRRFDVVLLDVDMGATDGIELASAIKKHAEGAEIRLVLLTSIGRRGDAKKAREAGLAAYLTKPVRERQLQDCLVTIMTQRPSPLRATTTNDPFPLVTRHTLAETKAEVDLRILLAEDNIINQKVAVRLFQRLGYRIDVVVNGREAVEAMSRIRYDVVFMDCQMPDMDGFEATRLIREREAAEIASSVELRVSGPRPNDSGSHPETGNQKLETTHRVPIIAMTANVMQGDRERCLAAGMDDYLSKPISADALAGALSRIGQEPERSGPDKSQEAA